MLTPVIDMDTAEEVDLALLLNELLDALDIPISIEAMYELTPSLLLAILESTLQTRIPVSQTLREARDLPSKVQSMQILLEYVEDHVLDHTVGLRNVDPRKLALGEGAEVAFIGEVLCWLGQQKGLLADASLSPPRWRPNHTPWPAPSAQDPSASLDDRSLEDPPSPSPSRSTHSTFTTRNSANSTLFITPSVQPAESDTTMQSVLPGTPRRSPLPVLDFFAPAPRAQSEAASASSRSHTPRCIHEVAEPSVLHRADGASGVISHCHCSTNADSSFSADTASESVRRSGWIEPARVDIDEELRSFEASRPSAPGSHPARTNTPRLSHYSGLSSLARTPPLGAAARRVVTRHNSPTQHTLALLNERAKLMSELASLKSPLTR